MGSQILNPYENISHKTVRRANFHAHSKAWAGLTNGVDTPDDILASYASRGYSIAAVSNYHQLVMTEEIDTGFINLPVYEHGFNLNKSHYLAITPAKISFYDALLFHTTHTRQSVINEISTKTSLICINHPSIRNSAPISDFKLLSNYSHIEIINGSKTSVLHWDSALSHGKKVWALSNDDIHDLRERKFGRSWTGVLCDTLTRKNVVKALMNGSSYAVHELGNSVDSLVAIPIPNSIYVSDQTVNITFNKYIDRVSVIGQKGKLLCEEQNAKVINYTIRPEDTYIRMEFRNNRFIVYSNPLVKVEGISSKSNSIATPKINLWKTYFFRVSIVFFWIGLLHLIFPNLSVLRKPKLVYQTKNYTKPNFSKT